MNEKNLMLPIRYQQKYLNIPLQMKPELSVYHFQSCMVTCVQLESGALLTSC